MTFDLTYSLAPPIDARPAKPKTTVVMVNHKPVTVPVAEDSDAGATPVESQAISRGCCRCISRPPSIRTSPSPAPPTAASPPRRCRRNLQVHHHRAGATIDSSLYLAGMQAGIPADIVVEMIHMFSYKVDFQRDLQPGDSFEVYYDYYYTPEGQPAKTGDIAYARLQAVAARTSRSTAISPIPTSRRIISTPRAKPPRAC